MFNKSRALWSRGSLALAGAAAAYDLPLAIVEPGKGLVLHGDTRTDPEDLVPKFIPGDSISVSWGFYLSELGDGSTCLVERWPADWNPTLLNTIFFRLFLQPGAVGH